MGIPEMQVVFETDEPGGTLGKFGIRSRSVARPDEATSHIFQSLFRAFNRVPEAARSSMEIVPNDLEIEVGIRIEADVVVITRRMSDAGMIVRMKWRKQE